MANYTKMLLAIFFKISHWYVGIPAAILELMRMAIKMFILLTPKSINIRWRIATAAFWHCFDFLNGSREVEKKKEFLRRQICKLVGTYADKQTDRQTDRQAAR